LEDLGKHTSIVLNAVLNEFVWEVVGLDSSGLRKERDPESYNKIVN